MAIIIGKDGKKEWSKVNKYQFDFNGNYYEKVDYGNGYMLTSRKIDDYGFDFNGIHQETKKIIDTNYFDRDGYYWKKDLESKRYIRTKNKINPRHFNREGIYCLIDENGKIKPTGETREPEGYDIKGLDINGFNRKGIHCITNKKINEYGFDKNGFYYEKNEKEEYVSTGSKYNPRGFKIDKTYKETGLLYNARKFNIDRINIITESELDLLGFNSEGINPANGKSVFDITGFKTDKTYRETGELYDEDGYNYYGIDKNGFDRDGNMPEEIRMLKAVLEKYNNTYEISRSKTYLFRGLEIAEYRKKHNKETEKVYKYICDVAFEQCPELIQRVFEEKFANNPDFDETDIKRQADYFKENLFEEWDLLY